MSQTVEEAKKMARETGIEPATSTVTGWYSNQLSYSPAQSKRTAFRFAVPLIYSAESQNSSRKEKKREIF